MCQECSPTRKQKIERMTAQAQALGNVQTAATATIAPVAFIAALGLATGWVEQLKL